MFYGNIVPKSEVVNLDKLYEAVLIESNNLIKVINSISVLTEFGILLEEGEEDSNNTEEKEENNEENKTEDNNENKDNAKQSIGSKIVGLVKKFIGFIQGLVDGLKQKFSKSADDQYVKQAEAVAEKTDYDKTVCKMFDMTDEYENIVKNKFVPGVKELKVDFENFSKQLQQLPRGQGNSDNVKFNEDKLKEILETFDKYGGINNCNGKNNECYTVVECKSKDQAKELISKFYTTKWTIWNALEDADNMITTLKLFTNENGNSGETLKDFDFDKVKQFSVYIADLTKIYNMAKKLVDDCDKVMRVNGDSFNKSEDEEEKNKEENKNNSNQQEEK